MQPNALEIANELNRIYDTSLTNDLVAALQTDALLVDVLLLCSQCKQPVKARINTPNWIRVEWIGSSGECLQCHQQSKAKNGEKVSNNGR